MKDHPVEQNHSRCSLSIGDVERKFYVFKPNFDPPDGKWPVVFAFHGGGTHARVMMRFCGLSEKAKQAGFVVVYPEGSGRVHWARTWNAGNCCGHAMRNKIDDVGFVGAILDELKDSASIDIHRVFATGMSNGAMLCYRLASEMAERIAAIAPVAGPMGAETCSPKRPVPVCHFHGQDDQFAPYRGGVGKRSRTGVNFYSVDHTIKAWVEANGCEARPGVSVLPTQVEDGTRVTRIAYEGGRDGSEVLLYSIEGGGHTWPGRENTFPMLGAWTGNVSANDEMWEFFQRHSLASSNS
jgi:polyhydroxybutyrate depolymerase